MKKIKNIALMLVVLALAFVVVGCSNDTPEAPATKEAKIGNIQYSNLATALEAAKEGDSIQLLKDVTLSTDTTIPAQIALEIPSGKTLTLASGAHLTLTKEADLTNSGTLRVLDGGRAIVKSGASILVEKELDQIAAHGQATIEAGGQVILQKDDNTYNFIGPNDDKSFYAVSSGSVHLGIAPDTDANIHVTVDGQVTLQAANSLNNPSFNSVVRNTEQFWAKDMLTVTEESKLTIASSASLEIRENASFINKGEVSVKGTMIVGKTEVLSGTGSFNLESTGALKLGSSTTSVVEYISANEQAIIKLEAGNMQFSSNSNNGYTFDIPKNSKMTVQGGTSGDGKYYHHGKFDVINVSGELVLGYAFGNNGTIDVKSGGSLVINAPLTSTDDGKATCKVILATDGQVSGSAKPDGMGTAGTYIGSGAIWTK